MPLNAGAIVQCAGLLRHRGPDDEGYLLGNSRTQSTCVAGGEDTDTRLDLPNAQCFDGIPVDLVFGFRRLAILDLSADGHQPMRSEDGRYWLVFNGEIYNYRELRDELRNLGFTFRSSSDSEVLLNSFVQWGEDCLDRLNGMFSFLIWDAREHRLFGARDRFGEKPLYYTRTPDGWAFASEIKALFPIIGHVPRLRSAVVREYLQHGFADFSDNTFYEGIFSLPAAHKFSLVDGEHRIACYWELTEAVTTTGDPIERFRDLFLDALKLRTRSDVPLGTCLSGGLDSSAIVCGLSHILSQCNGQVTRKTFTAAYSEFDESALVTLINEQSGSSGHSIAPKPTGIDELRQLLWYHDEPFHSFTVFASHEVMRLAREHGIIVLLNGQGADETLAGYPKFLYDYLFLLLRQGRFFQAAVTARRGGDLIQQGPVTGLWLALYYGLLNSWRFARSSTDSSRANDRDAVQRCCLQPDFVSDANHNPVADLDVPLRDGLKRRLYRSIHRSHLPLYLRVEDRNSMAHSMESRLPFLDHRLAEFAFSLPSEVLMRNGQNKWLLREAMKGILPEPVRTRRQKFGFPTPQRDWILQDLRTSVEEALRSRPLHEVGVLDTTKLQERFEMDSRNRNYQSGSFWFRVLSFSAWLDCQSRLRGLCRDTPAQIAQA